MHRFSPLALGIASCAAMALAACSESASPTALAPAARPALGVGTTGNGAPSGAHFTLNIIGVSKTKTADMTGDNGRRIFVSLGKDDAVANTRINLTEGDFGVLDANGTDGTAAFQLPNPDPDGDGTTSYSVYVRALGKPGGSALMQTCYTDLTGTWCAADFAGGVSQIKIERTKGQQKFVNVSKDLLYVDFCTAWNAGVCTSVQQIPLFGDPTLSYFWSYDNSGLKNAQLRFYEVPTTTGF